MRITRLRLRNWKNFREADLMLRNRVFLVGPNASGKSNVLDAFRFLQDLTRSGGGLEAAVESRGDVGRIRCLAARRHSDIELTAQFGEDAESPEWEYELAFSQDNNQRPIVKREIVRARNRRNSVLERPNRDDESDPDRLTQTFLEQVSANKDFREIPEFLRTIRYLHVVPQLIRDPNRGAKPVKGDPYGSDFLESLAGVPEKTRSSRLGAINEALRRAVPLFEELDLERDNRGVPHLKARYEHWRKHGAWQHEDQFSDGTLRLIGFLWALYEGTGPLLLEEPELSLHSEVVRHIPQMIARVQLAQAKRKRQVIVSTHSRELLGDSGIAPGEVFYLEPSREGTTVRCLADAPHLTELIRGGTSAGDVLMGATRPKDAAELANITPAS